ncbi:5'-deoxyadenosine deaminase [Salibacterium salarium]|uniref:5-methylthioadenosine/S-adenosylhomocysteine deaminase n=1 Tax=Salibacterium salarium TaxID=284579 RepID=A0A3R9P446_9BACI|nr:5'-deoxyadenosine deaminase [Salibacterium salarium]RSL32393.1 5'-deoxyadenosine deaminase [Salibacterium salarium]
METTLIQNAEIITMNDQLDIVYGDLLIEDNKIAKIGDDLTNDIHWNTRVIDGTGKTVLPGFVQTHIHLCQTLFRGQADDMELLDWLKKKMWPLEAAHDPESLYYSAKLGIGELIQGGTTTIMDMETVHHTNAAFEAMADSGIRALSGKVMMDLGEDLPSALLEETEQSISESIDLLNKWHGYDNNRIQYAFCPRFVVSCTEDLLMRVRDLSDYYNVLVHTHASENKEEVSIVEDRHGMRNVEYLDYIGLATERLVLAHCIWLSEREKQIIRDRNVRMTHCPGSNLKLASGIADVYELSQQGSSISLGADGASCNNNLDMFQEMRLAALLPKPYHGPASMPAKEVLKMATTSGAKALGMENDIGSLEVGKKADLFLLDLKNFHSYPQETVDPISRVVYSASAQDVETTIIDGKVVMENRDMKTMDKDKVLEQSNISIKRLVSQLTNIV